MIATSTGEDRQVVNQEPIAADLENLVNSQGHEW
jgi:hypothetical protein